LPSFHIATSASFVVGMQDNQGNPILLAGAGVSKEEGSTRPTATPWPY